MKASAHGAGELGRERAHVVAVYDVTAAVAGPRTVYRASFDVGFELPSPESTVVVDPSAARLAGSFEPLDVAVAATAIAPGDPPVVTLNGPREVRRVAFGSAKSYVGSNVQLFRLDQQQVAPKETVSAPVQSGNAATAFGGFTDVRFAVAVQGAALKKSEIASITVRGAATGVRLGLADPAAPDSPEFFWPTPDQTGTDVDAGAAFGKALQAYLQGKAGSPTARLVIQGDQPCRFVLTAFETGASFALDGFASPALAASDLTDPDGLAARIRAADDPVSAHLRVAIGSAELLDGLNAVIAGDALYDAQRFAGVSLSPATQAELAAGGDLPRLNRLLLEDAYPDAIAAPAAKRVLRFDGAGVTAVGAAVSLPAGARVSKATVSTQESLLADRPLDGRLAQAADGHKGVHVGGDGTEAVSLAVDEAVSATGVALPLVALAAGTEVTVELQDDWQGAPSGKRLAAGTAALSAPGEPSWTSVFFAPVVLAAGPVWLVLRAAKGEAVWLAAAAASGGLRVRRTLDGGSANETVLAGLAPQYELFSRSGDALDRPASVLRVGGTTVAPTRDGDRATYDIAAALAEAGGGTVPLMFASPVAGTITVYPPHVEFGV